MAGKGSNKIGNIGSVDKVGKVSRLSTRGKGEKEDKQRALEWGVEDKKERDVDKKKVTFLDSSRTEEERNYRFK